MTLTDHERFHMMEELSPRVKAGAILLDEKYPGWWVTVKARLEDDYELDMGSCGQCVIGHLNDSRGLGGLFYESEAWLATVTQIFHPSHPDEAFNLAGEYGFDAPGKYYDMLRSDDFEGTALAFLNDSFDVIGNLWREEIDARAKAQCVL